MADDKGRIEREEIFSKAVRAGKRTYFFDVKTTRGNDLYLTITESKKRFQDDGKFFYEKHKLFLYKEDFDKFSEGLSETIEKIQELRDSHGYAPDQSERSDSQRGDDQASTGQDTSNESEKKQDFSDNSFTDVNFEDLGKDDNA